MKYLVAYVPVLHEGYRRFFTKHDGPKELYILGTDLSNDYKSLTKEIRQLDPELMRAAIESLGIFSRVHVLHKAGIELLNEDGREIIMPDEDVSEDIASKYLTKARVTFDSIFLRWDKKNAEQEKGVVPDERITRDGFHRRVMRDALVEAEKSSDIWRHVGASVVKDGKVVLTAYNRHLPSEHSPYVHGDPRGNWSRGDHMELATGFHAEASIVAEAARRGISLAGADMYVTVFPCPPCSKILAFSGIKTLYCAGGNSILDAEAVMKDSGIKIVYVE